MKKSVAITLGLCMAASLVATKPCSAAFTVGGENGWQLTTDGIVDVFATYNMTQADPSKAGHTYGGFPTIQTGSTEYDQRFGVGIGLLPSVVAFNIKAPTTNGVDSTVRVGIYPTIQNRGQNGLGNRFETNPNIDFREIFYTAKGKYGEILAGRALNLYMGKNILTDMTVLTAGVVPQPGLRGGTTLGHIAYGYLYANFGPQMRYTTPDFGGAKFAISVNEPYNTSQYAQKTNSPRVEAELSFAKTFGGGLSVNSWLSGMYQTAVINNAPLLNPDRLGKNNESIGGGYGIGVGIKGLNLLASGYGGKGLGMVSAQDGTLGNNAADAMGHERLFWGFLVQSTYRINPSFMVGVNYGQSRLEETENDVANRAATSQKTTQEALTTNVTYNMNAFTQFILEYSFAQDRWADGAKQHSNQIALGTMFYW